MSIEEQMEDINHKQNIETQISIYEQKINTSIMAITQLEIDATDTIDALKGHILDMRERVAELHEELN